MSEQHDTNMHKTESYEFKTKVADNAHKLQLDKRGLHLDRHLQAFQILKGVRPTYGLTELEVYVPKVAQQQVDFIKMEIDDNVVSTLFLPENQEIFRYRIAQFDKYGTPVNRSMKYEFLIFASDGDVMEIKSRCFYFPLGFKSCCLRVTSKDNPALYDQIVVRRQSGITKFLHTVPYGSEKALFHVEYFMNKVIKFIEQHSSIPKR